MPIDFAVGFFDEVAWVKLFALDPLLAFDATAVPFAVFEALNPSFILLAMIMMVCRLQCQRLPFEPKYIQN